MTGWHVTIDGQSAAASITGVLPCKDFVLIQPAGITVVLAPFAALSHFIGGRHALGAARIFTAIAFRRCVHHFCELTVCSHLHRKPI
jgi:hypothetical protein